MDHTYLGKTRHAQLTSQTHRQPSPPNNHHHVTRKHRRKISPPMWRLTPMWKYLWRSLTLDSRSLHLASGTSQPLGLQRACLGVRPDLGHDSMLRFVIQSHSWSFLSWNSGTEWDSVGWRKHADSNIFSFCHTSWHRYNYNGFNHLYPTRFPTHPNTSLNHLRLRTVSQVPVLWRKRHITGVLKGKTLGGALHGNTGNRNPIFYHLKWPFPGRLPSMLWLDRVAILMSLSHFC